MIAAVSGWIKEIIMVVLFASFMELLLPSSSMQKFIRVIIGLFIMLAILNPILDILNNNLSPEAVSLVATVPNKSINSGDVSAITGEREKLSLELYKKELAKQVKAVVATIDGVADARVAVEVGSGSDGNPDGRIKGITVYVQPGIAAMGGGISPISKIKIGEKSQPDARNELRPQLVSKIQHSVSELYQLSANQIEVKLLY